MSELIRAEQAVILSTTTSTGHTVSALISAWLAGFTESEATRAAYAGDLREYIAWCVRRQYDPLTVKLADVQMYAAERAHTPSARTGKPLSVKTRNRKLAAVSSWYDFLVDAGAVEYNPAKKVKRPKYDRHHSPTSSVTQKEATAMLAAARETVVAPGRVPHIGPATSALVMSLLIDLGIRVSEACNAHMTDLGWRQGMRTLTVRMKGGKVRTRPIPAQITHVLDAYLAGRPAPAEGHEDALLLTVDGVRINRHQVDSLVKRVARHAEVPSARALSPHSMRHAFNTIARERGAALEDRRDAMGHSSAAVTQLYDHVALSLHRDPAHLVAAATAIDEPDPSPGIDHNEQEH